MPRSQPARQAQQGVETLLGDVMEELRSLREEVNSIKQREKEVVTDKEKPQSTQGHSIEKPHEISREGMPQESGSSAYSGACNYPPIASTSSPTPSSALPLVDIVPDTLRKDIVTGKNVNLVQLLIPARERGNFAAGREINIGGENMLLKPLGDKRLSKALTISEYVKAFNIYKNILCEAFLSRRAEMDRYVSIIIDISSKYQGFAHCEYHLEFAARAAHFKEHQQILLDWGVIDDRLLTQIVTGCKANTCALCGGYDHVTTFCHLVDSATEKHDNMERRGAESFTPPVCKYYNTPAGCKRGPCTYSHHCALCKVPDIQKLSVSSQVSLCRFLSLRKERTWTPGPRKEFGVKYDSFTRIKLFIVNYCYILSSLSLSHSHIYFYY